MKRKGYFLLTALEVLPTAFGPVLWQCIVGRVLGGGDLLPLWLDANVRQGEESVRIPRPPPRAEPL